MTKSPIKDNKETIFQKRNSILIDELSASEVRYRRLFESAKDGILILDAESGKIVDVNPFLTELLGYTKQNLIEKSIWEIGAFQDIYENKEKFLELQQKEYVRYDDLPLVTSKGLEIHVEFVSNVYLANNIKVIQCNIRDITENRQIKNQIAESEEKFRIITENSPDAIFITDKEGKYIYVNKQAIDLLGYSKEELLTFSLADISPKSRIEEYFQIFQQLFTKGSSYSEIELVKKDGSFADTDLNAVLLPNGWIYGSCRDISKRKQLEKELINAKERAEESDHLKSAFLANMSHEIRTPMNGILGFASLLKKSNLSGKKQQNYIQIIEKSGTRMLNIINDIVNISKIESGLMEINLSVSNVNEQIEYIHTFFKPEIESKGIQFLFNNTLSFRNANIKTDREKLFAILTNLVKNAIKYTEKGLIELGYVKKDSCLEFYVKDSGIGIDSYRLEAIFERFIQADVSDTHAYQGAGLGLSISKSYVEMLGGKLWVESEKEKGSIFYFTIPYSTELQETVEITDDTATEVIDNQVKNLKILIVEDDEISDLFISTTLEEISNEILHAKNGLDAIELCHNNPDIDLILMDIKMPVMNGYESTRQIRQFNKNVIIIAQTAYGLVGDREKTIEAGCNAYLSKPIIKDELLSLINQYFIK